MGLFFDKYVLLFLGVVVGAFATWLVQIVLRKRGTFSYFVTHNRVGTSSVDKVLGEVSVTWNKNPVAHLYFSTLVLRNESLNDYENVSFTTYTDDTVLLSEYTALVDTPDILPWSEDYQDRLRVEPGEAATTEQMDLHARRREYAIPVFNRGQVATVSYLNVPRSDSDPHIFCQ